MNEFLYILKIPAVHGALIGAATAAAVDYHAFLAWKSFHDFATYNWGTAAFRWLQGAVVGSVGASGLSALLGVA